MTESLSPAAQRQINNLLRRRIAFWSNNPRDGYPFPMLERVLARLEADGRPYERPFEGLVDFIHRFQNTPNGFHYTDRIQLLHDLDTLIGEYHAIGARDRGHAPDPAYATEPEEEDGDQGERVEIHWPAYHRQQRPQQEQHLPPAAVIAHWYQGEVDQPAVARAYPYPAPYSPP